MVVISNDGSMISIPPTRNKDGVDADWSRLVNTTSYSTYNPQADITDIVLSPYSFSYTTTTADILLTRIVAMQKSLENDESNDHSSALLSLPSDFYMDPTIDYLKELVKENKQLLNFITTPYMDFVDGNSDVVHPPSILRRASSMTLHTPAVIVKTQKKKENLFGIPTPLGHTSTKARSGKAAIITKNIHPFVVTTLNDQACRLLSISESDTQNRSSILDFIPGQSHQYITDMILSQSQSKIKASGLIIEIKGFDKLASIWVESMSTDLLLWALEEVPIHDIIPKTFETIGPCASSYTTLDGEILLHSTKFEAKPRTISCILALSHDLYIKDYNHQVLEIMLGYSMHDLIGKHITKILPQFLEFWPFIESYCDVPGIVVPEHLFRKYAGVLVNSDGFLSPYPPKDPNISVYALNTFGFKICVDIQLRVVSDDLICLWISYTHQSAESDESNSRSGLITPSTPSLTRMYRDNNNYHKMVQDAIANSDEEPENIHTSPLLTVNNRMCKSRHDKSSDSLMSLDISEDRRASLTTVWSSSSIAASLRCTPEPNMVPKQTVDAIKVGSQKRTKNIHNFEVIKDLGHGAYGEVKLVWDPTKQYVIALKSIYKDRILVDTWSRDRALGVIPNEIKILNQLRKVPHPNIVDFLDYFEDTSCYHVEMVPLSLSNVLDLFDFVDVQSSQTSQLNLLLIWQQIVSAVAHIHSLGIVHRDLKDENVIIDTNRFVKLIDFGSAAYVKQGPFDVFVGTVDYAAPEILQGDPYEGRAQDNWALGILLYTIMFAETPFRSPQEIMSAELPADMICLGKPLIEKLLMKNPEQRMSAAETSVEIKQIIYNEVS